MEQSNQNIESPQNVGASDHNEDIAQTLTSTNLATSNLLPAGGPVSGVAEASNEAGGIDEMMVDQENKQNPDTEEDQ